MSAVPLFTTLLEMQGWPGFSTTAMLLIEPFSEDARLA